MLRAAPAKNHGGLILIGDYLSLKQLYEVIHEVNEQSPLIANKEGSFLGLAYDVRHAYDGLSEKITSRMPEIGPEFGVKIIWPVFLWQLALLRKSLAFMPSTAKQQAATYALEHIRNELLKEEFPESAQHIIEACDRLDATNTEFENMLVSRGGLFCAWTKAERKEKLLSLINTFNWGYDFQRERYKDVKHSGLLIDLAEFEGWTKQRDWPDPKI